MEYLLGVDLGTSGTKTVLFDVNGQAIASETVEYPLHQPQNGWAEQAPEDWWDAARTTIRSVIDQSGVNAQDIKGLGISGQMHGLVLLDADGNVLREAILWCDGRTQEECDEITNTIGRERLIQITANPALTGFTAGKILWVRKHEPELWAKVRHILLPKDYVRFKLTGEYASEMSDASGTNLLDVPNRCWSKEILDALNIDDNLMPRLTESSDVAGYITSEAAQVTGLIPGTPVAGGAGDNAAAAVGTGVVVEGKAFTTIGTSGVVFAHSDKVQIDPQGRVHTFCAAVPGAYTVMSCTLAAGLSLKWYRDTFCQAEIDAAKEMDTDPYILMNQQAEKSPIGANRLIFLPYLMGERSPLLDSNARGAFIGLSAIHTRKDLLRAVMEGVTYSQRQNLDVLRQMHVAPETMLACGGGAKSPFWRKMMADVFNMPVKTVKNTEGPALGAAILAGVAAGIYKDIPTACAQVIRENEPLTPGTAEHNAYERVYSVYESLYPALKGAYGELAQL
ncbi:MAG: xylulokinase [Clostridiales bacterium]|nr:xylulokinase [Clostridiales bacterium]